MFFPGVDFFRYDYTYHEDIQGWLKFHPIPATWHDARLRCQLEGNFFSNTCFVNKTGADVKEVGPSAHTKAVSEKGSNSEVTNTLTFC